MINAQLLLVEIVVLVDTSEITNKADDGTIRTSSSWSSSFTSELTTEYITDPVDGNKIVVLFK